MRRSLGIQFIVVSCFLVLFCVSFLISFGSTEAELSTEEPEMIFIEDEIRINVVFLGLPADSEDEAEVEKRVIDWYAPIDYEQSIRTQYYIPMGVNYSLDIRYFNAPEEMVDDLSEYHNESYYRDSEVEDYLDSSREEYLEHYLDEVYGEDDYGGVSVYNIDATKTEDWLQLHTEDYAGLDGILDEYTLFFIYPHFGDGFYYYSVNTTDVDTNEDFHANDLNAYGGNYNFFFFDWLALPPKYGDGFEYGEVAGMESYSPIWHLWAMDEDPGDGYIADCISKYVNESIQYLFLPSYIYTPTYELKYELDLLAIDCTEDDSFKDVAEWYIDRSTIEDELERVIPYANWTFEMGKVDVDDLPDLKEELDRTTETQTIWFDEHKIIDAAAMKDICDTYVTRPDGVVTIPVFIFVFDEYGWVDTLRTAGRAEGYENGTFWGVLLTNGMESMDEDGYGLTGTIIHEIGHILSLMHPHDGFKMDDTGLSFETSWFWDFSNTPMVYYSDMRLYEFNEFNTDTIDRGHVLYLLNQTLWMWHSINTTLLEKRYTYDVLPKNIAESLDLIHENVTSTIKEFKNENYFVYQYGIWDAWSHALAAREVATTTYGNVLDLSTYNHPPTITLLSPEKTAEDVLLTSLLSWQGADNDSGDILTYTLYLGEETPDALSLVFMESEAREYLPTVDYGRVYYWKVVVSDGKHVVESEIWSFSTVFNQPPEITLLSPTDGAGDVPLASFLDWEGSDVDSGDSLKFSVYLGTGSIGNMVLIAENQTENSFEPVLVYETAYFWKLVVTDGINTKESNVWFFTTAEEPEPEPEQNMKPKAFINSIVPDTTTEGDSIQFDGRGTDKDGTVVKYVWRSSIDGVFYNGTAPACSYSKLSPGTHTIYFEVQDNNGTWSDEASLAVIVEKRTENSGEVGYLEGFEHGGVFVGFLLLFLWERRKRRKTINET